MIFDLFSCTSFSVSNLSCVEEHFVHTVHVQVTTLYLPVFSDSLFVETCICNQPTPFLSKRVVVTHVTCTLAGAEEEESEVNGQLVPAAESRLRGLPGRSRQI